MTVHRDRPGPVRALWYVAPECARVLDEPAPPAAEGALTVRTRFSAISRGTERLVYRGAVPAAERVRMRAPHQAGEFPFPVKYGYAAVGDVVDGPPEHLGRTVFALVPHQTAFVLPADAVVPVPPGVPARRAVLAANMETALNAVWDAGALPGARIAVVGAGVVGALVGWLVGRMPGVEATLVDVRTERRALADALGLRFAPPEAAPSGCDLVFHASATDAGLATALAAAGDEASLVELSWYGDRAVAAPLGGAFHAGRLRIVSSQVGRVAPAMRARWDTRRRLRTAIGLLADPCLDALLEPDIAFERLPEALPELLGVHASGLCPVVSYP